MVIVPYRRQHLSLTFLFSVNSLVNYVLPSQIMLFESFNPINILGVILSLLCRQQLQCFIPDESDLVCRK